MLEVVARKKPERYVGATKPMTIREAVRLGPGYAIQPKHDGVYVRVALDSRGRVGRMFMRSGAEPPAFVTTHLIGALVGNPHAELVGELDWFSDVAEAAAKIGPRRVRVFDCLHDGARSLVREPYRVRRDAAWRMSAAVQCYSPADDHRPRPYRRYRDAVEPGWRLFPMVEQVPIARAGWAWDAWVKEQDGEGLVAVALDAPAGARNAKLKVKAWESIDALVVTAARTTIVCAWNGHPFTVGRTRAADGVREGDVVEVRHAGWYAAGVTPRFPALARVRRDLH